MSRGGAMLVLVALLAGGVVGYALRHAADRPGDVSPTFVPESPGDPVDRPLPLGDRPPDYPPVPRGAAPPADALSGRGRVTGTVRTESGEPLAGVVVRAELNLPWRSAPRPATGVPPDTDLVNRIRQMADRERFRREVRREAVTGADGSYVIHGLAEQMYLLNAYRNGYVITREGRRARAFGPGETCNFRARRVREIEARVLLPDGTVPERAFLSFESGGLRASFAWRPGDPVILLGPGTWRAAVTAGAAREYELIGAELTVPEDETDLVRTFRLEPRPGITGRVHGVTRTPERRMEVRYLPVPPNAEPDLDKLRRNGERASHRGPPEYRFAITGIPDGRYAVGLIEDSLVVDVKTVEVKGDQSHVDLEAPPFDPTAYVSVRLVGSGGEPLSLGRVSALFLPDDPTGGGVAVGTGIMMGDGEFRVRHPQRSSEHADKPGRYFLEVRVDSHGSRRVPYAGPTASTATVRFESPAGLTIVLEGYDRKEYLGHTEIHMKREEQGQLVHQTCPGFTKLGLDGRQIWRPLTPGRYEIEVRSKHGEGFGFSVVKVPVELVSGEQVRTVSLPDLHTLTLLVAGAEPRTRFSVRSAAPGQYTYWSGTRRAKDGRVTAGPLLAGDYVVTEDRSEKPARTMTLKITRSAEVVFQPE